MTVDTFTRGADENAELFQRDIDLRSEIGWRHAVESAQGSTNDFFGSPVDNPPSISNLELF
jgi:hypothetical protein